MRIHDIAKNMDDAGGDPRDKVLDDAQLKQLHRVFLSMLDDMVVICREHDLKFCLIGGNAIGAVRHGGFIPWDDDVDIAMTRADYDRLIPIIRRDYSDKYIITDPRDVDNFGKVIPKLRLKGTTYYSVLDHPREDHGVRLDVFPLENTYDNWLMRMIHGIGCYGFGFALSCRRFYKDRAKYRQYRYLSFKVKTAIGFFLSFASIERWARWTDHWYSLCKNDRSKYATIPSDAPFFFGSLVKRAEFCDYAWMDYEGRKYPLPGGLDSYLRAVYGDYMTIPPVEKRIREKYLEFDLSGFKAPVGGK